jgi:hypothetical protein
MNQVAVSAVRNAATDLAAAAILTGDGLARMTFLALPPASAPTTRREQDDAHADAAVSCGAPKDRQEGRQEVLTQ